MLSWPELGRALRGGMDMPSPIPWTLLQTITIQIPHERIRNYVNDVAPLSRYEEITHPVEGLRKHYIFGIGMLFYGAGTNQIIFDQFNFKFDRKQSGATCDRTP